MQKFELSESFLEKYKKLKPNWGPLGNFVFLRTYSRKKDDNTNERWWETVKRVVEGSFSVQKEHCFTLKLPWKNTKAQKSAQVMYDKIFNFKFLPSGRGLWMSGTKFVEERGASPLQSCAFITTQDIETRGSFAFTWSMDALMVGCGVGFDTLGSGKISIKQPKENTNLLFEIPDTREGWVESLELLLDAYFYGKQLPKFDYSKIRKAGEIIKGFGGVSSGPDPLKELHKDIKKLLDKRVDNVITSVDIVDIMNLIARTVISGNVRRSAMIAFGMPEDKDYVTMKDYKLHPKELQSHRWASNNSIFAAVGKTDYKSIENSIIMNGEPGIIWLDNARKYGRIKDGETWIDKNVMGSNPCSEQFLESSETCLLVETFPSLHETFDEYKETLKYAYLFAKAITLIPTHWPETNAVMMKNRRIGLSQSGIVDAFVKHGRRNLLNWCDKGYKYLRELDDTYSNWLCIPKSIKITTTKPSGTVSLLPGVSPGIHYPHAEYYIRRVRIAANSPLVLPLKVAGYPIEESKYGSEETKKETLVVSFPIHEKNFSVKKDDATIWEQVKNIADYQYWWSDNAVSCTVTFKKEEGKEIHKVLEAYEDSLKSVSFLPLDGGKYEQMPYEEITKEQYEKLAKDIVEPNFSSIFVEGLGEKYCSNDSCEILPVEKK